MYIYDATKREQILLEPGDYVIALWATNFYGGSTAVYDLELSGRDYIFATGVELTCREDENFYKCDRQKNGEITSDCNDDPGECR